MPANPLKHDAVEIVVGGVAHQGWESYDIESDLMTPADAWSVTLAQTEIKLPANVKPGAPVLVRVGGQTVLSGAIDERSHKVSKGSHTLQMSGRDDAGVLLDCSAPIFTRQKLTIAEIVASVVRPLGIIKHNISAENLLLREKVSVEPGDTAWDVLKNAAEANGLWPWLEPDGTLTVGGPDYTAPVVARLVMRYDGVGNNIEDVTEKVSQAGLHSEITVLGQAHAVGSNDGKHNIKGGAKNPAVQGYRPKTITDHEAINTQIADAKAAKLLSDERVKGYDLALLVKGHRTPEGLLYKPGQRIEVLCEPLGIDGVYFLMARRFSGNRGKGQVTHLTLREDGVWALYAHPKTRKHRRGKNALPLKSLTVGGAP